MPTVAETARCPDCEAHLKAGATRCACGWSAKAASVKQGGPDYARIAAERERSMARAYEPIGKKLACQSMLCSPAARARPGRDLCQACAELEDAGRKVPRIRRPRWIKSAGELLNEEAA